MDFGNERAKSGLLSCSFNDLIKSGKWLRLVSGAENIILSTVNIYESTSIVKKKLRDKFELRYTGIWSVDILNYTETGNYLARNNKEENDLIIYFFKTSEPGIFTEPDSCGVYFFIRCLVRGFEFEDLI